MAQPISNLTQNNNSLAGLFSPVQKPLTTGLSMSGAAGNTTPAVTASQTNNALVKSPVPYNSFLSSFASPTSTTQSGTGQTGLIQTPITSATQAPLATNAAVTSPLATPQTVNSFNTAGSPGSNDVPTTQTPVTGLFPNIVSSLAGAGTANAALGQNAQNIAADAGKRIADIGTRGALATGGIGKTNPVVFGNNALIAQNTAAQQQAVAQGANVALTGNQQALGAQGQSQSALTSAGNLAAPQASYPFVFNPTTGAYTNAGGGVLSAQDAAQAVMSGKLSYDQAKSSLGYLGGTGEAQLQQAITSAGGNALALQAQGQAQQSNIQTGGTASANSYAGIYDTANTNAANYSQQQSAINAVGTQALTLMNSLPARSSSQFVNTKLNQLATQFSSPEYAAFNTAIQSLQARIGQALQAGEIPTAATGNAKAIANGDLTIGALASTLQQVDSELGAFVKTQNDLANYAKSQITTGTGGSQNDPLGIR